MSTLKTHNLQSPDAGSVNITMTPNAGMVVTGISTFTGAIDANGDLDVDGHTNLDNVSISGITTFSNRAYLSHDLTITGTAPRVIFTDTDNNSDYRINVDAGNFEVQDITNSYATRLRITSTGKVNIGDTQMSQNIFNIEDGTAAALDIASHGTGGDTAYIGVKKSSGGGLTIGISNRDIIFKTGATYSSGTVFDSGNEKVRITSGGLLQLNNDSAKIQLGTSQDLSIYHDGSSNRIIAANADLILQSNNYNIRSENGSSTYLNIDSSGRLLTGGATVSQGSTNADDLQIGANNQSNQTGITLGSASGSGIRFADAGNDSAGAVNYYHSDDSMRFTAQGNERFRIKSGGNVEILDGNLIIGTSGHGIDFSATSDGTGTNHNELLDEYEEGDWQPTVSNGGANWSTTGRYTKVGRMVTIQADITNTSGSGTTEIHNLPFAVDSKYGTWHVGYAAVNGTTTSGNTNFTGGLIHFQGNGYLRARASGGTSNITMGNNHRTIFTGIYYTN